MSGMGRLLKKIDKSVGDYAFARGAIGQSLKKLTGEV